MIEVNLGEEEPEDIAVRRYLKAVTESKVLEVLRWRKTKETKIEAGRPLMNGHHVQVASTRLSRSLIHCPSGLQATHA